MNKGHWIKISFSVAAIGGALVYLLFFSLKDAMVYYKTVDELWAQSARFDGRPVRVNGLYVPGSLRQKPGTDQFRFQLKKRDQMLEVAYAGVLPDSMLENRELIVQGTLDVKQSLFTATQIVTKCPSKYEAKAKAIAP